MIKGVDLNDFFKLVTDLDKALRATYLTWVFAFRSKYRSAIMSSRLTYSMIATELCREATFMTVIRTTLKVVKGRSFALFEPLADDDELADF